MPGGQVHTDNCPHAVADHYCALDSELIAQPRDVVGEDGHGVVTFWRVTVAVSVEVDRQNTMILLEMSELRGEEGTVASPSVHEHQRGTAGPSNL